MKFLKKFLYKTSQVYILLYVPPKLKNKWEENDLPKPETTP